MERVRPVDRCVWLGQMDTQVWKQRCGNKVIPELVTFCQLLVSEKHRQNIGSFWILSREGLTVCVCSIPLLGNNFAVVVVLLQT